MISRIILLSWLLVALGTGCKSAPTLTIQGSRHEKKAIVKVRLSNQFSGPFTLTEQHPIILVPYANNRASITSKRLPVNVMSHLFPGGSGISASDAIAKCVLTDCGAIPASAQANTSSGWGFTQWSKVGRNDRANPFYYGQATDPWYSLSGCDDAPFLNGLKFHAPSGAKWSQGTDDESITVWDQPSQMLITLDTGTGGNHALPASTCPGSGPASCAVPVNAATYCQAEKFDQERDWGYTKQPAPFGGGNSNVTGTGFSSFAGIVRYEEMLEGKINHAIRLLDDCHNSTTRFVFPNIPNNGVTGMICNSPTVDSGVTSPDRPASGMLLFLDYTDAQIEGMNIPGWKKTLVTVMARYGGYIGITGGHFGGNLGLALGQNNEESPQAYDFLGVPDPFLPWIASQPEVTVRPDPTGSDRYQVNFLAGLPLLRGPGGSDTSGRSCSSGPGCDVSGHLHVADPCIVKTMAGEPGGC